VTELPRILGRNGDLALTVRLRKSKLMPVVGSYVQITGEMFQRSGIKAIVIEQIKKGMTRSRKLMNRISKSPLLFHVGVHLRTRNEVSL